MSSKIELMKKYISELNKDEFNSEETMDYIHALMRQVRNKNANIEMKKLYNSINQKYKPKESSGGKHKKHTRKHKQVRKRKHTRKH